MSATLCLAPTTDAVLGHILEHVHSVSRTRSLTPITFLLPTGDAIRQLRQALGDVVAVRLLQFYNLSTAILGEAGSATHEMGDIATRRLVRGLLAGMDDAGELTAFRPMLDKPGFIDVLMEWLREMKTQGIRPEAVANHATREGNARDRQLALLYVRYQEALHTADCADADGLLWLAAEALEADQRLACVMGELVLAGFDQFSPVQLRIVAALAGRLPVTVYLLWDERRRPDSLALGRLAITRVELEKALAPVRVALPHVEACGPALAHIRLALFESDAGAAPDEERCIAAIAAPSAEAEVRYALRKIKALLLTDVRPEAIALLAPHPATYRRIVAAVGREYGVPIACETTLAENPCAAAFFNLLALAPQFPWRQTFDALRCPYLMQTWLDQQQIALLDRLTRERPVLGGQDQWWHAIRPSPARHCDPDAEDEDRGEPATIDTLDADTVEALRSGLAAFFTHLTPPPQADYAGYVLWLQEAVLGLREEPDGDEEEGRPRASLHMVEAARQGDAAARDLAALNALLGALRAFLDAVSLTHELRPNVSSGERVTWEDFTAELLDWLPSAPVPHNPMEVAVRYGPLQAARAVTVDHLFVLGLGEGEFPRPPQPDALYTLAERAAHPLPLAQMRAGEDASLWWQVLSNCRCSLTLLRSRYDANGAGWLPSAYWTAVVDLVEGLPGRVEEPRLAVQPDVAGAASPGELLEALALGGAEVVPGELAGVWQAVLAARTVAAQRDGWEPPGPHEGVVADNEVLAGVRRRFGPGRSWSVSRLNRYGVCPFAFWAQYGLKLEALPDPAEGLDAMQRGSLVHEILETLFARLGAEGLAPGPDQEPAIMARLAGVCDEVLPRASENYGFRPGPLWDHEQNELRRELQAYMAWECQPEQAGGFRPFLQELAFGLPRSSHRAVTLIGLDGATTSLSGVIDRVDRDAEGNLRVIDYKTGSTLISEKDILAGRALQSALYAWAAESLLPEMGPVVASCYRHTGVRKQSGRIGSEDDGVAPTVLAAAGQALRAVGEVLEGRFAAAPSRGGGGQACTERCDFIGLCRVTRHSAVKARRGGAA